MICALASPASLPLVIPSPSKTLSSRQWWIAARLCRGMASLRTNTCAHPPPSLIHLLCMRALNVCAHSAGVAGETAPRRGQIQLSTAVRLSAPRLG